MNVLHVVQENTILLPELHIVTIALLDFFLQVAKQHARHVLSEVLQIRLALLHAVPAIQDLSA
jgi:hypothetical protein